MKKYRFILLVLSLLVVSPWPVLSQERQKMKQPLGKQVDNPVVKKGIRLFKEKKYSEAEQVFLDVLKTEEQNLIAKEMLAGIYYHLQDPEQARRYAQMSLRQNTKSGHAFLILAWVATTQGKMLAARDLLAKAERLAKNEMVREEILNFRENYKDQFQAPSQPMSTRADTIPGSGKPYLAVFPFEDNTEETETGKRGETISEMMVTALTQTNRYRVMERIQLGKVLDEQALGQSGALEQQTAVEVGKLVGVTAIVVGTVSMLDDRLELDTRIIDAVSGEVQKAASSSADDEGELRAAVNTLVEKLNQEKEIKTIPKKK